MKIAMISGNPLGDDYGGVSMHVKHLISHLSKFNDINLILLTFGNKNSTYERDGIKIIVLKRLKFGKLIFPLQLFYDMFRLESEIQRINPDLIHIQSTIPLFSLLGIHMSRRYPMIITVHGYLTEEYKYHVGIEKLFYGLFCAPLERVSLSKIPNVIAVCPQIKNIIKKITTSKIFVIPNGINLEHIQKIKPHKKYDYPTILYLGVLTKRKGVDDLIKAISLVKIKVNNVKLYIAGTGPYLERLKKIVKELGLMEDVKFLGFITEEEKFSYMKSIDIFVLPTYWESFPIVLPEAMACGKPIVTTNVAGNPFAVSDCINGFLVEPGNWHKIAEKLISMLNDQMLIEEMGKESKKRASDFDWTVIAKQTRELYMKICK